MTASNSSKPTSLLRSLTATATVGFSMVLANPANAQSIPTAMTEVGRGFYVQLN